MAIRVSCPSCKSDVHVDESLAGKDILCPSCKERLTVPSIAAGQPEMMPGGADFDDDDRFREGAGPGGLPRWGDDDDVVQREHDTRRWAATATGLALIFWNWLFIAILGGIFMVLGMFLAGDAQAMAMRPGAPPPPQMIAFGFISLGLICLLVILLIISFVGMCLCCTVPAESGAKGRAITSVILIGVTVVLVVILFLASVVQSIQLAQKMGGPPPPGQMPFSPGTMVAITIIGVVDLVALVTMWMLFHMAIGAYFANKRLVRMSLGFIIGFLTYEAGSIVLNIFVNPALQGGNIFQMRLDSPAMIIASIWGAIWLIGLSVLFLWIVRETRRTILEGDAPHAGDVRDNYGA
jgi:hypothetical protein